MESTRMNVRILGPSNAEFGDRQYASSYLINECVALDAGYIGFCGRPTEQKQIREVFLTHSHADHIASLPMFLENVYDESADCPTIHGSLETLDSIQRHVFNDVIWPDFIAMSQSMPPFVRINTLEHEVQCSVRGLSIIPVPVHHAVPALGYIVSDKSSSIVFSGDTGPTARIWEIARNFENLRAVFLDTCFPNSMNRLAQISGHLTPATLAVEISKIPADVKIYAVHIKANFLECVERELEELGLENLEVAQYGINYSF
jgi:cAMP phosphodiesterase